MWPTSAAQVPCLTPCPTQPSMPKPRPLSPPTPHTNSKKRTNFDLAAAVVPVVPVVKAPLTMARTATKIMLCFNRVKPMNWVDRIMVVFQAHTTLPRRMEVL